MSIREGKGRIRNLGVAAALLLGAASAAAAQDQQVGARTKAMGGSYTAFEDDPVSIWLNPGGIATQTDGGTIDYQTYTLYDLKTSPSGGAPTSRSQLGWSDPAFLPSYLGAIFQLGSSESPQALGICFATPFRLRLAYLPYDFTTGASGTTPGLTVDQSFYRIRAAYARDFRFKPEGLFTHLAIGIGGDVNITDWTFTEFKVINGGTDTATLTFTDRNVGFGGGAGLLLGVYDNRSDFKVNFGAAYQSKASYSFSIDAVDVPLFDWPNQFQGGLTFYLLDGLPLRLTADAQVIQWSSAVRHSLLSGVSSFRNVTNYSAGAEYAIPASERVKLYPRAGVRYFNAPWSDQNDLPAVGLQRLAITTKSGSFVIGSFGLGVGWANDAGKSRMFDLGVDFGGDQPGFALAFTMEF
ncbi:MAG TPA: hypothetical protein VKW04_18980 [Planctomycetota bacterium]|nr:hypothetical protein [Planctomycetota bacterium]